MSERTEGVSPQEEGDKGEVEKKRATRVGEGSSSHTFAGDTKGTGHYSPSEYQLPEGGISRLENIDEIGDLAVFPDDPSNRFFRKIGKGEYEEISDEEAQPLVEKLAADLERRGFSHKLRDNEPKGFTNKADFRVSLEKACQRILGKEI